MTLLKFRRSEVGGTEALVVEHRATGAWTAIHSDGPDEALTLNQVENALRSLCGHIEALQPSEPDKLLSPEEFAIDQKLALLFHQRGQQPP